MIRENIDLSFPSPPPASLGKYSGCSISFHMGCSPPCLCVSTPLCILGLIFGHSVVTVKRFWKRGRHELEMSCLPHWLTSMSIDSWREQKCQSNGFHLSFHFLFLCLFSMLQPVKFIMWGQLSSGFCSFFNSCPKRANPTLCKGWAIKCVCFCCPVSLSVVIKNTMFLLFREVPYWVSWFNSSWQLGTMQPLAHQAIGCQWTTSLIPLLVSSLSSARFYCDFLKVTSLTHGNISTRVAATRKVITKSPWACTYRNKNKMKQRTVSWSSCCCPCQSTLTCDRVAPMLWCNGPAWWEMD